MLAHVEGTERLFLTLLYGTGLRLMEGLRLRVKDVDFAENQITVRDGKGAKDRVPMLPVSLQDDLRRHLRRVERQHKEDLGEGLREGLPSVRVGEEVPLGGRGMGVAVRLSGGGPVAGSAIGIERRHHLPEQSIQRSFRRAVQQAGLAKAAKSQTQGIGNGAVGILNQGPDPGYDVVGTNRQGQAQLAQDAADGVDASSAVTDPGGAQPVQSRECLLRDRLDRDGMDLLVAMSFEQALGVGTIGLVAPHVGFDVGRGQQQNLVAELPGW